MSYFPYTIVTSTSGVVDYSGYPYFPEYAFLFDAAAGNITFTFPDESGNDANLFIFSRYDSSGPGTNTVTLTAINSQTIGGTATYNLANNVTIFIWCVNGNYIVK